MQSHPSFGQSICRCSTDNHIPTNYVLNANLNQTLNLTLTPTPTLTINPYPKLSKQLLINRQFDHLQLDYPNKVGPHIGLGIYHKDLPIHISIGHSAQMSRSSFLVTVETFNALLDQDPCCLSKQTTYWFRHLSHKCSYTHQSRSSGSIFSNLQQNLFPGNITGSIFPLTEFPIKCLIPIQG